MCVVFQPANLQWDTRQRLPSIHRPNTQHFSHKRGGDRVMSFHVSHLVIPCQLSLLSMIVFCTFWFCTSSFTMNISHHSPDGYIFCEFYFLSDKSRYSIVQHEYEIIMLDRRRYHSLLFTYRQNVQYVFGNVPITVQNIESAI